MATALPPVPDRLKAVAPYVKIAAEHDARDPVIAYWCRLYALQNGMKVDRSSSDCRVFLMAYMDWLEKEKSLRKDDEAISSDVVAQAHIENRALKLFLWADGEDRAARFNKNVVKAFYTAGFLFDILTTFGELTEEITNHRKYARWKAAYIHRCLKNGEQPIPGPLKGDDEGFEEDAGAVGGMGGPSPSNGPEGEASGSDDPFVPSPSNGPEGEASGSDDPFVPSFPQMGGAHAPGFVLPPVQPAGGATGGPRLSYGDGQPGLVSLPVPTPGSQAPPSTPSGSAQPSPSMTPLDLPRAASESRVLPATVIGGLRGAGLSPSLLLRDWFLGILVS
uniref:Putative vacuolar protein n=1 Tax=Ixodes ricinus TaxID=34613 RepID=A0A6B0VA06_IXORI